VAKMLDQALGAYNSYEHYMRDANVL